MLATKKANVRHGRCVLGIDVGATNIRAGLVHLPTGLIHCARATRTEASRGGHHALTRVATLARRVIEEGKANSLFASMVGIGVPELVDHDGNIRSSHSLAWGTEDVRAQLRAYGEVTIASDVRAAALAEARLGAGRFEPTFLYISAGTGVSSTLVVDGRPFCGAHGHAIAFASGTTCATSSIKGKVTFECLEDRASGGGLVRRARTLGVTALDARALCRQALREPGKAREIVDAAAKELAIHVAILANALDPGLIVMGGGVGCARGRYWSSFRAALPQHAWGPHARQLRVRRAALGTRAGVIGAALSTLHEGGKLPEGAQKRRRSSTVRNRYRSG